MIAVQQNDFSVAEEYENLSQKGKTGAIVTFVGRVREFSNNNNTLHLQHYPGMTEKTLHRIAIEAKEKWPLQNTRIIHRFGDLLPGDQIVFVGVSAAHRGDAFQACEYIIDILKTQAPFWKKEGDTWVAAKASDAAAADRWFTKGSNE